MIFMAEWIQFFISVFIQCVDYLLSCQIMGVGVLWILGAVFLMGVLIRALIFKP